MKRGLSTPELVRRLKQRMRRMEHGYQVAHVVTQIRDEGVVQQFARSTTVEEILESGYGARGYTRYNVEEALRGPLKRLRR